MTDKKPNKQEDLADDPFLNVIRAEDEVGAVIRAHVHIEHHLMELIRITFPRAKAVEKLRLDFYELIQLAYAAGAIDDGLARTLRAFAQFRNRFAHNLDVTITAAMMNDLVKTLSEKTKFAMNRAYELNRVEFGSTWEKSLKQRSAQDRFVFFAVVIRAALIARGLELREE